MSLATQPHHGETSRFGIDAAEAMAPTPCSRESRHVREATTHIIVDVPNDAFALGHASELR